MDFRNKKITFRDGRTYCFLSSKPVESISNRSICLLNVLEGEADYSLWLMETDGEEDAFFWPYKGSDTLDLIKELLEKFIETAFD
ncbi:MAG: hypothetical protein FWC03_07585 [Treponema sp.]|nr:hypothetical protein [Treponema sp.]